MSTQVFPSLPGLKIRVRRETLHKTTVQTTQNGQELRIRRWSGPKYRYHLEFEFLRKTGGAQDEVEQLQTFIKYHGGSFDSFLYDDPIDGVQRRVRIEDEDIEFEQIGKGFWAVGDLSFLTTSVDYGSHVQPSAASTSIVIPGANDTAWMMTIDDFGALYTSTVFGSTSGPAVIVLSPDAARWSISCAESGALITTADATETTPTTISLSSPNGTQWSVTVTNDGALYTAEAT